MAHHKLVHNPKVSCMPFDIASPLIQDVIKSQYILRILAAAWVIISPPRRGWIGARKLQSIGRLGKVERVSAMNKPN
eukprot:5525224-Amphidinium_carterae.1